MQQISYRGQQKHELKVADARTLLGRLRQRALRLLQATKGWTESEDTTGQVGSLCCVLLWEAIHILFVLLFLRPFLPLTFGISILFFFFSRLIMHIGNTTKYHHIENTTKYHHIENTTKNRFGCWLQLVVVGV